MAELELNLYDYSKQLVSQMKPLDPLEFNTQIAEIGYSMSKNKYTMLYCKDLSDFTIFVSKDDTGCPKNFATNLAETIANRGHLITTELQSDGAWEIWIRSRESKEDNVYYLFDYSNGIVEV